jgi:hypothetical protein
VFDILIRGIKYTILGDEMSLAYYQENHSTPLRNSHKSGPVNIKCVYRKKVHSARNVYIGEDGNIWISSVLDYMYGPVMRGLKWGAEIYHDIDDVLEGHILELHDVLMGSAMASFCGSPTIYKKDPHDYCLETGDNSYLISIPEGSITLRRDRTPEDGPLVPDTILTLNNAVIYVCFNPQNAISHAEKLTKFMELLKPDRLHTGNLLILKDLISGLTGSFQELASSWIEIFGSKRGAGASNNAFLAL